MHSHHMHLNWAYLIHAQKDNNLLQKILIIPLYFISDVKLISGISVHIILYMCMLVKLYEVSDCIVDMKMMPPIREKVLTKNTQRS